MVPTKRRKANGRKPVREGIRIKHAATTGNEACRSIVMIDEIEADAVTGLESCTVQSRPIRRNDKDDD
jgi:hypothetical protein